MLGLSLIWICLLARTTFSQNCDPGGERIDCGYFGIDQTECEEERGCCWSPAVEPGAPWCFRNTTTTKICESDEDMKFDCGYFGIGEEECNAMGCCWEESITDPWCFYPFVNCDVEPEERKDCGYLGIDAIECGMRGCCWEPTDEEGVPWCYSPGSD